MGENSNHISQKDAPAWSDQDGHTQPLFTHVQTPPTKATITRIREHSLTTTQGKTHNIITTCIVGMQAIGHC